MKLMMVCLLFITSFFYSIGSVSAQEDPEAESVPFAVQANLPENQVNSGVTYFDIEMELGQEQELEVVVYNSSDEAIEVAVSSNTAATNSNGVITYDGNIQEFDDSMKYPFHEISKVEQEIIEVAPQSKEVASITVKAPEEPFDGHILGGLHFQLINEKNEAQEGVSIQNQYAYVIGVNIIESGNSNEVAPELTLEQVYPDLVNHRTGIQTTFINPTPVLISDLTFEGQIYSNKDEENPLYSRTMDSFSVAPNNIFHFPISLNNERLEPGEYIFRGTAQNEEQAWEFEDAFTIEEEAAEEVNEQAVELVDTEDSPPWLVVGLIIVVIILLVIIGWLYKRLNSK